MTKCPRWLWQPACAAGGWPKAGSCEQCAAQNPLRLQGPEPIILPSYYTLFMTEVSQVTVAASLCCWWMAWGWVLWGVCCPKPSPSPGVRTHNTVFLLHPIHDIKCPRWLRQPAYAAGGWPEAGPCEQCAAQNPLRLQGPVPTILPSYYILFMTMCPRWLWQPACAAGGWPEAGSCEQCVSQNPLRLQGSGPQYYLPITSYSWLSVPGDCGSQPLLLVNDLRLGPVSSVLPKTLSDSRGPGPKILPSYYTLFMTKCPRWLWQPACAAGGWPYAGSCE